jgi:hypothetical protein
MKPWKGFTPVMGDKDWGWASAVNVVEKWPRQQLLKSNRKSSMLVSSDFSYSYPDIPCQRPFPKK